MDTNRINQKLDKIEACLRDGQELTAAQLEELKKISLSILYKRGLFNRLRRILDHSQEVHSLCERIAGIRNWNFRLRTAHHIEELEKQYDELEKEYLSPSTTPERKAELAKESERVSSALRILQR